MNCLSAGLDSNLKDVNSGGVLHLKMTGMIVKKVCLHCRLKVVCFRYILLYRVIEAMLIAMQVIGRILFPACFGGAGALAAHYP